MTFEPSDLTSREVQRAHDVVHEGRIRRCGINPLVELLCQSGFAAHGLLGCVQVPVGDDVFSFAGNAMRYKKTVPVWVIERESTRPGRSHDLIYMDTKDFVSWLRQNMAQAATAASRLSTIPEGFASPVRRNTDPGPSFQSSSGSASADARVFPVVTGALPLIERVPLPSTTGDGDPMRSAPDALVNHGQRTINSPTVVPLPSTYGGVREGVVTPPPPPSYVSQLGDSSVDIHDPLLHAESEFQSVPRLDGGTRFDPDEYVNRITRLNLARVSANLLPVSGVTPSTYTR